MNELLSTENLKSGYKATVVLPDITLSVRSGEIVVLAGPNGSGKSTLLATIAGNLPPMGGRTLLLDRDLTPRDTRFRAQNLSVLLTQRPAPELMTARELVAIGRAPFTCLTGALTEEDHQIIEDSLALVGANALADTLFTSLSDGQKQLVLLARAIAQEPKVLLLDEPTSYLDIRHKLLLLDVLARLARERGTSILLSMHEIELAQKFADRLITLKNGRIHGEGRPEDLITDEYIQNLYDLSGGVYTSVTGSLELTYTKETQPSTNSSYQNSIKLSQSSIHTSATTKEDQSLPPVFVLGGGGSGIPVYRRLKKAGIPFAAGIFPKNDLDYPTANALADICLSLPAFSLVTSGDIEKAQKLLAAATTVYVPLTSFGPANALLQTLLADAKAAGKLRPLP